MLAVGTEYRDFGACRQADSPRPMDHAGARQTAAAYLRRSLRHPVDLHDGHLKNRLKPLPRGGRQWHGDGAEKPQVMRWRSAGTLYLFEKGHEERGRRREPGGPQIRQVRHEFLNCAFPTADHAAARQQRSQQRRHDAVNVEHRHRGQHAIRGIQGQGLDHGTGADEKVGMGERHDLRSGCGAGRLQQKGDFVNARALRQSASPDWHIERIQSEHR